MKSRLKLDHVALLMAVEESAVEQSSVGRSHHLWGVQHNNALRSFPLFKFLRLVCGLAFALSLAVTPASAQIDLTNGSASLGGVNLGNINLDPTIQNSLSQIGQVQNVIGQVQTNPLGAISTIGNIAGINLGSFTGSLGNIFNTINSISSILQSPLSIFQQVLNFPGIDLGTFQPVEYGIANFDDSGSSTDPGLFLPLADQFKKTALENVQPNAPINVANTTGLLSLGGLSATGALTTGVSHMDSSRREGTTGEQVAMHRQFVAEVVGPIVATRPFSERVAIEAVSPTFAAALADQKEENGELVKYLEEQQKTIEERAKNDPAALRILECQKQILASDPLASAGQSAAGAASGNNNSQIPATRLWALKQCIDNPGGLNGEVGKSVEIVSGSLQPGAGENCMSVSLCNDENYVPETVSSANQKIKEMQASCMEKIEFIHRFFGDVCCSVTPPSSNGAVQPLDAARNALRGNEFQCTGYLPTYRSENAKDASGEPLAGVPALFLDEVERRYKGMMLSLKARCECENKKTGSAFAVPSGYPFSPDKRCADAMESAMAQAASGANGGSGSSGASCYQGLSKNGANDMFWDSGCEGWRKLMRSLSSVDFQFIEHGEAIYKFALKNMVMQKANGRSIGQNDDRPCDVLDPTSGEWSYDNLWGPSGKARSQPSAIPEVMTVLYTISNFTTISYTWFDVREWVVGFLEQKIARNSGMAKAVQNLIEQQIPKEFWQEYEAYKVKIAKILEFLRIGFLSQEPGQIRHSQTGKSGNETGAFK